MQWKKKILQFSVETKNPNDKNIYKINDTVKKEVRIFNKEITGCKLLPLTTEFVENDKLPRPTK